MEKVRKKKEKGLLLTSIRDQNTYMCDLIFCCSFFCAYSIRFNPYYGNSKRQENKRADGWMWMKWAGSHRQFIKNQIIIVRNYSINIGWDLRISVCDIAEIMDFFFIWTRLLWLNQQEFILSCSSCKKVSPNFY